MVGLIKKKFKTIEDIPEFPFTKDEEQFDRVVLDYIGAGAIAKDSLKVGALYEGQSRSTNLAQWTGTKFRFIKDKMSGSYIDAINHFQDDNGYDVFIPFKLIYSYD